GDRIFFAMEYVEGTDLARLVHDSGPLSVAQACNYIRQAALGLQHAHERGMVHRDIKPGNLLIAEPSASGGLVKISDLGLARLRRGDNESSGRALTREGAVLGTLDYVAPEQATDAHAVDHRADLYSLGCTFYFLLAGRAPYANSPGMEKLFRHHFEEPTAL